MLTPDRGTIGEKLSVTFHGAGIGLAPEKMTVTFDPAGPVVDRLATLGDDDLKVELTIPAGVTEGVRAVTVEGNEATYGTASFQVEGLSFFPAAVRAGTHRIVTLKGLGIGQHGTPDLYFSQFSDARSSKIGVSAITRISDDEIRATLDVSEVALGEFQAHLSSFSKPVSYTVRALPRVDSVTPNAVRKGFSADVTLKGNGFSDYQTDDAATTIHVGSLLSPSVVTVSDLTIVDDATITARLSAKDSTVADWYHIVVGKKSPDADPFVYGTPGLDKLLRIGAGVPHIDSISPNPTGDDNPTFTLRGTQLSGTVIEVVLEAGDFTATTFEVASIIGVSDTEVQVHLRQTKTPYALGSGKIGLRCDGVESNLVSFTLEGGRARNLPGGGTVK